MRPAGPQNIGTLPKFTLRALTHEDRRAQ
jgi:hypothetical protein